MAYGNKFVKTQERRDVRISVTSPSGSTYSIDPWMDVKVMTPWELTEAIRYFLDLKLATGKKPSKPNRFVHVQRT